MNRSPPPSAHASRSRRGHSCVAAPHRIRRRMHDRIIGPSSGVEHPPAVRAFQARARSLAETGVQSHAVRTSTGDASLPSRLHARTGRGELRLCLLFDMARDWRRSCGNESDGLATGRVPIRLRRTDRGGDTVVDMDIYTIERLDLAQTFVRLSNDGEHQRPSRSPRRSGVARVPPRAATGSWASSTSPQQRAFTAPSQEVHPDGDELIVVLAGALDVMIDDGSSETAIALDAGHAAVVRRGMLAPARHARSRATLVHQHPNVDAEPSPPPAEPGTP